MQKLNNIYVYRNIINNLLLVWSISECPKQKISPGREVVCYTSVSEVELLTESICRCTTLVQKGLNVQNLSVSGKFLTPSISIFDIYTKIACSFERRIPWFLIIAMIEARRSYRMIFHLLWMKGKKKKNGVGRSCEIYQENGCEERSWKWIFFRKKRVSND